MSCHAAMPCTVMSRSNALHCHVTLRCIVLCMMPCTMYHPMMPFTVMSFPKMCHLKLVFFNILSEMALYLKLVWTNSRTGNLGVLCVKGRQMYASIRLQLHVGAWAFVPLPSLKKIRTDSESAYLHDLAFQKYDVVKKSTLSSL